MTRAYDKIADHDARGRRDHGREIVCHRCGAQCVLPAATRVDETVCVGCVQRLADVDDRDAWPRAARNLAAWADKAAVRGPGYGVVSCPHCAVECVVEVGETTRTGCVACLRPLGERPLVREDLPMRQQIPVEPGAGEDDVLGRDLGGWRVVEPRPCAFFPGEPL